MNELTIIQEASADSVIAAMLGGALLVFVSSLFSKIGNKSKAKKTEKEIQIFRNNIDSLNIDGLNDKITAILSHLSTLIPGLQSIGIYPYSITVASPERFIVQIIVVKSENKIRVAFTSKKLDKVTEFDINTPIESIIESINLNN